MAFTQDDLDALTNAASRGEQQVQFQGRMVTFRSVKDLLEARDRVRYELARAANKTNSPKYVRQRGGW